MRSHALDRDVLHDAITRCTTSEKLYAWGTTLEDLPINLSSIGVKDTELALPIEIQELNKLLNDPSKNEASKVKDPVVIDKLGLHDPKGCTTPIKTVLTQLATVAVQQTFNVDSLSFKVEAVPDKLLICSQAQAFCEQFNIEKVPGTFGCMLLQIPVKGVTGGGTVTVQYGEESIFLQFDEYSQSKFYLAVLAGKKKTTGRQDYTIRAANQSPCVMLVVSLVWLNALDPLPKVEPDRFPQYVEAAHLADRALAGWGQLCHEIKKKHLPSTPNRTVHEGAYWVNTSAANPTGYYRSSSASPKLPLLHASSTRALCLPLTGDYSHESYSITALLGVDALIFRILNSINYINLELLLVETSETHRLDLVDWRERVLMENQINISIIKRITQDDCYLQALDKVTLNTSSNLVGNLKSKTRCSHRRKLSSELNKCLACSRNGSQSFHVALLIHPKGVHAVNEREKFIKFHLSDLLSQISRLKEHEDNGNCLQEISIVIEDLCQDETFKSEVTKVILTLLAVKGWKSWEKIVMKLMKETNISRTYHTFHNLALKFHQSNRIIQSEQLIFTLAEVFFKSTNHEYLEIVMPFLLDTLVTLLDFSLPQPKYQKLAEELFDKLPDVSLATILEHRNNININNEIFFQLLANLIGRRTLNGFVTYHPLVESLKGSNQTIFSQLIKKNNCNAFIDHLKNFSPAIARQALNAIIANLSCEISCLDAMTDAFSFLVTIESNELLANEMRPTLLFTSVVQHHLPTLCLLPMKLRTSGAFSGQNKCALKIYRALMESLVINQVWDVVRLSGDVVGEVIDCLFWLRDEALNLLFINKLILLGNGSFKCFRSNLLKNFVGLVLEGSKTGLEESKATHLVRLWMKYLATSEGGINLSSSLLSKILYFCFPSNLKQRDNRLSKLLVQLVDKAKSDWLVDFLVEVQDERMKDTDRVLADGVSYLCVLYKACLKLMSDPLRLASLPDEKRNAVLLMLDTVFRLGDGKMVVDLARLILDNKDLPHSDPILYDELMDSCSALERVPLSGAKEEVERGLSWCVRDAVVPGNKQLESFLRSDLRCQSFGGNYTVREKAVAFGSRLVGISPSPVLLQVKPVGMSYVCELVKERSSLALPFQSQLVSPLNSIPQQVVPNPSLNCDAGVVSIWCIEDAFVPGNRQLESFLRSDFQSQLFPLSAFTDVKRAQRLCQHLLHQSPWPIHVVIKQAEGGYFCEATKALPRQSTHLGLSLTNVNPTTAVLPVPNLQPPHLIGDNSNRKRRHRNRSRSKNRLPDKIFVN